MSLKTISNPGVRPALMMARIFSAMLYLPFEIFSEMFSGEEGSPCQYEEETYASV
jgi:hypothetical protein